MRSIDQIIDELRQYIDNPEVGLPEELFLFLTEITPMVNVDLLIRDTKGRYLLAWRNTPPFEIGWHIPGGIISVKESLHKRIEKTSIKEIGCIVKYGLQPLTMIEDINDVKTRSHFYSFLYNCTIPDDFDISKQPYKSGGAGFLQWHDCFPNDMIIAHYKYKKFFDK